MYSSGYSQVSKYSPQAQKKMKYQSKGKSCGYYLRIIFFFSSLIQSLIIVSLVLFLVYGKTQDSASTARIQDLEESFSRLSIENVALRQQRRNLTNLLNVTLVEKTRNEWDLLKIRHISNISAMVIQDLDKRLQQTNAELMMCKNQARFPQQCSQPSVMRSVGCNCGLQMEHLTARLELVESNFTQTTQRMRMDMDQIAKERDSLELEAIRLRRDKSVHQNEIEFSRKRCKEDFVQSLSGISNVSRAFLQKIESLFPTYIALQLTCQKQREHLEQIRSNCTSLSREVVDRFQNYLNTVGDQVSEIQTEKSHLKAENLRLFDDYRSCSQNRTGLIQEHRQNLEKLQLKHDKDYERLLLEKRRLNGDIEVLENNVNYKNKEVQHLTEQLRQLNTSCMAKTGIGGFPGGSSSFGQFGRVGSDGLGSSFNSPGLGSNKPVLGSSNFGSTGSGLNRLGSTALGSPSLGSTGSGLNRLGSSGLGSPSLGSTGSGLNRQGSLGLGSSSPGSTGSGLNKQVSTGLGSSGFSSTGSGFNRLGSTGMGSPSLGSTGSGLNRQGSPGLGSSSPVSTGLGSTSLSSTGSGLNRQGSPGLGSSSPVSTGLGSSGLGSTGSGLNKLGSTGLGSSGLGSTGSGLNKLGSTGLGSSGLGLTVSGVDKQASTGLGSSSLGSTGSGLNKLRSTGLDSLGLGTIGLGLNNQGSTGLGSSSLGATGSGLTTSESTGLGSSSLGSTGLGLNQLGSTGLDSSSLGSTGSGLNNRGSTGLGSSSLGSTGSGFNKLGSSFGTSFGSAPSNPSLSSSANKPTSSMKTSSGLGSAGSTSKNGPSNSLFSLFGLGPSNSNTGQSKPGSGIGRGTANGSPLGTGRTGSLGGGGSVSIAQHLQDLQRIINPSYPSEERQDLSRMLG